MSLNDKILNGNNIYDGNNTVLHEDNDDLINNDYIFE